MSTTNEQIPDTDEPGEPQPQKEDKTEENVDDGFHQVALSDVKVDDDHTKTLLEFFMRTTCDANAVDPRVQFALDTSIRFFQREYVVLKVNNSEGNLCRHYPATIPIPINNTFLGGNEIDNVVKEIRDLIAVSHFARCRDRFPVPVIMYENRYICRSSTVAIDLDMLMRLAMHKFPQVIGGKQDIIEALENSDRKTAAQIELSNGAAATQAADIKLLKKWNVRTVINLMVEKQKIKYGLTVSSSETVAQNAQYQTNFDLLTMPYPGCEFFKEFYDNNLHAEGLHFNWEQPMCNIHFSVPKQYRPDYLNIDWVQYRDWELIVMTQNYMKLIVNSFRERDTSIVIHCISGWDRTPLFISLLRLSLWADGIIHKTLNSKEMLYFTLAYDWMLFGHHLVNRLQKKEHIMMFCFYVLKFLWDDEFSFFHYAEMNPPREEPKPGRSNDGAEDGDDVASAAKKQKIAMDDDWELLEKPTADTEVGSDSSEPWVALSKTGSPQISEPDLSSSPSCQSRRTALLTEVRTAFYTCFHQSLSPTQITYKNETTFMTNLTRNINDMISTWGLIPDEFDDENEPGKKTENATKNDNQNASGDDTEKKQN